MQPGFLTYQVDNALTWVPNLIALIRFLPGRTENPAGLLDEPGFFLSDISSRNMLCNWSMYNILVWYAKKKVNGYN